MYKYSGAKLDNSKGKEIKLTYKDSLERYIIYPDGKIQNSNTGRFLTSHIDGSGYRYFTLSSNGKIHKLRVHILLARTFIKNDFDQKKFVVNHLDCDKSNNKVSNLEIATYSSNTKHYYDNKDLCNQNRIKNNNPKVPLVITENYVELLEM